MKNRIESIGVERLAEYAGVPMVCDVQSTLDLDAINNETDWRKIPEKPVIDSYIKDYDACADGGPLDWPARFELANWGFWLARDATAAVGGAAVAWNTPGVDMLEGRRDLAVLWDIRVRNTSQRQGVGSSLFHEAARWAKARDCRVLKIETQDVNVTACRFYARMGCTLQRIDRSAYCNEPGVADETMLIWELKL